MFYVIRTTRYAIRITGGVSSFYAKQSQLPGQEGRGSQISDWGACRGGGAKQSQFWAFWGSEWGWGGRRMTEDRRRRTDERGAGISDLKFGLSGREGRSGVFQDLGSQISDLRLGPSGLGAGWGNFRLYRGAEGTRIGCLRPARADGTGEIGLRAGIE